MGHDDPDNCPTFTRRPPAIDVVEPVAAPAGSLPHERIASSTPPRLPSGAPPADDDDGPITDVDDEPPTFSVGPPRVPTEMLDRFAALLAEQQATLFERAARLGVDIE